MPVLQSIFVVDDEQIQRDGLVKIIKKNCPNAEVSSFSNGQEVCHALQDMPCDLLLTDISMPVMTGIELIKIVAPQYPQLKIVMVSAYQEFEYAKTAIQYQIKDYLIKPFRASEVANLLSNIEKELEAERAAAETLHGYEVMAHNAQLSSINDALSGLLTGTIPSGDFDKTEYGELAASGTVAILQWINQTPDSGRHDGAVTPERKETLFRQIRNSFSRLWVVYPAEKLEGRIGAAYLMLSGETPSGAEQKLKGTISNIRREGVYIWCGISNRQENLLEDAAKAFSQASDALAYKFYAPCGELFTYENQCGEMNSPMLSMAGYETELRRWFRDGNSDEIGETVLKLKQELLNGLMLNPFKVKHRVSSMVMSVLQELDRVLPQADYDAILNRAYRDYYDCCFFEDLFSVSHKLLKAGAQAYRLSLAEADSAEICIAYIQSHLDEDLSLQTVAKRMCFHPNYLSAQIKGKTGLSYSNYVLKLRMELACALLTDTDDKIRVIAQRCGFQDDNYFIRVFKREHGIPPELYRRARAKW